MLFFCHAAWHHLMPSSLGEWTSSSHESTSGPLSGFLLMSAMLSSICQCGVPRDQRGYGPASLLLLAQEPNGL